MRFSSCYVGIAAVQPGLRGPRRRGQDVGAQGCHQECRQCVPVPCLRGPWDRDSPHVGVRCCPVSEEMQQEAIDCATQVRAVSTRLQAAPLWAGSAALPGARGTPCQGPRRDARWHAGLLARLPWLGWQQPATPGAVVTCHSTPAAASRRPVAVGAFPLRSRNCLPAGGLAPPVTRGCRLSTRRGELRHTGASAGTAAACGVLGRTAPTESTPGGT